MGTKQVIIMTPELMAYEDTRSSSEIESDIRKTRGRMDSTLDELGNRLTARSLLNSALDWWDAPQSGNQGSAAIRKAALTLARQARSHPMPAVLIGAGVAWLISESVESSNGENPQRSHPRSRGPETYPPREGAEPDSPVGDWVGSKVDNAKDAATGAIDSVREKTNQLGEKMQDAKGRLEEHAHLALDRSKSAARHVSDELKAGYHAAEKKISRACDEYPLAVGLAFAGLGALAGLLIPRTRREDDLMGERSDRLVEETKEKASELLETGKEVGVQVLQTVQEEARGQGFTASSVTDAISHLAEKGGQLLQKAKDEAVHAAEDRGLKLKQESQESSEGKSDPDV
jgi:Protein of unknown function (DUF3618)